MSDHESSRRLLHITTPAAWERAVAAGEYRHPSLETEGFIHCSYRDQLLIPANERYGGRSDLIVLVIDPDRLSASVVEEDCDQSGRSFPHVYGPIETAAVERYVDLPPDADGRFRLPEDL